MSEKDKMTKTQDIQLKQLEIELETRKGERLEKMHKFKIEELKIRKEIAEVYRSKKGKNRIAKKINKLEKEEIKRC